MSLPGWGDRGELDQSEINSSLRKTAVLGCSPLGWLIAGGFLPASPAADLWDDVSPPSFSEAGGCLSHPSLLLALGLSTGSAEFLAF